MIDPFEDHCWQNIVSAKDMEMYRRNRREVYVGPAPALVAIDLYEMAYQGGPLPVDEVSQTYPSSCGEHAWTAIAPTQRLFAAARSAGIPIFYTTVETRSDARPSGIMATNRYPNLPDAALFEIYGAFTPQPGDTVIRKARASAFFGTPLSAHLTTLGIQSIIIFGESTSGCLRASAVDAYSHGYHVTVVEECCYDRTLISHQVNLFDLHHKYADVMHVDEVVAHLESPPLAKTG
jgi:nicotinamidase-related amidase